RHRARFGRADAAPGARGGGVPGRRTGLVGAAVTVAADPLRRAVRGRRRPARRRARHRRLPPARHRPAGAPPPPPGGARPPGEEGGLMRVTFTVNGREETAEDVWEGESLLYVLRERLGLPGSKNACEQGECGSCTVYLDGLPVCACLVAA